MKESILLITVTGAVILMGITVYQTYFPLYEGTVIETERDAILVYTGGEAPSELPFSAGELEKYESDLVWFYTRNDFPEPGDRVRIRAGSGTEESLPPRKEARSIKLLN
ncbi:DUF3221 domain-containing protein [Alteribacter natronophilus]|uniref:DUF3221 domain-containing protein n=1 Tax=Alteribacter natronophilus TaxID=2583810 RepID=UPI00110DBE2A|nr:DUF3221 domain-containing protein [Alteribacter natronophilus]TMW72859.1 DUF3221 domain-containing protein [Alteribacter natronophilus]